MVSIFLVEDERLARESIRDNIDWESHYVKFLGEASDGELALPMILEQKPDIVLTDIKMPFMDGLELSKIVKERLPDTKIIIISGHDEFDYARNAIALGVSEYLLKPIASDGILKAVLKIRDEIVRERNDRKDQSFDDENLHRIFLNAFLAGNIDSENNLNELIKKTGMKTNCSVSMVSYFLLKDRSVESKKELLDALQQYKVAHKRFLYFALTKNEYIVLWQGSSEDEINMYKNHFLEALNDTGIAYQELYFEGKMVTSISDIPLSYQDAKQKSRIPKEGAGMELSGLLLMERQQVLDLFETGSLEEINHFWSDYIHERSSQMHSYSFRSYVFAELFFVLMKSCDTLGIDQKEIFNSHLSMDSIANENTTDEHYLSIAYNYSEKIISKRKKLTNKNFSQVEKAKHYIQKNYADDSLTLQSVADHVSVTPSYFSSVFKQKTGKNFSEYVTEVRIEQAKKLLKTTDLTASEIAFKVGYHNANYFSVIFKKVTGVSPTEYR